MKTKHEDRNKIEERGPDNRKSWGEYSGGDYGGN